MSQVSEMVMFFVTPDINKRRVLIVDTTHFHDDKLGTFTQSSTTCKRKTQNVDIAGHFNSQDTSTVTVKHLRISSIHIKSAITQTTFADD